MKQECIFKIGGEGGSIAIYREKRKTETVFIYNHHETDFSKEGLDISKRNEFLHFEDALKLITTKYPIHVLYLDAVYPDFRNEILKAILDHLNNFEGKLVHEDEFYSKDQFEKLLGVRFQMDKQNVFTGLHNLSIKPIDETSTYSPNLFKELNIVGNIEIQYNSLVIKDENNQLAYIFPSDKFIVELLALNKTQCLWIFKEF